MGNLPPLPPYLTLDETAQALTDRLGSPWTARHVLGCASRGEISVFARIPIDAPMVRCAPLDGELNEQVFDAGSLPRIGAAAAAALLNAPNVSYTEHTEMVALPASLVGEGEQIRSMQATWKLAQGATPPEITMADCRVLSHAVEQIIEKYGGGSKGGAMLPPTMFDLNRVRADSAYTEEQVFGLGISGEVVFLVVVPEVGACRVPEAALSHFMAGASEYRADTMPEHYSGALSGQWTIKREMLRILADSWHKWTTVSDKFSEMVTTTQAGWTSTRTKGTWEAGEMDKQNRHALDRFYMVEAAEVMAAAHGFDAADFLNTRMRPAYESGKLHLLDPRDVGPVAGRPCRVYGDWVTPANMDKWLECDGFTIRWPRGEAQPLASEPQAAPVVAETTDRTAKRQAQRHQMCVEHGLQMPDNDYAVLPRGIGKLAKKLDISRQAFAEDVKAHIRRQAATRS